MLGPALSPRAGRLALIAGAGSGGRLIASELRDNWQWRLIPVGFVDDEASLHGTEIDGLRVLGDTAALPALARQWHVDVVVLAMPSVAEARREEIAGVARDAGTEVLTMPPLGSILSGAQAPSTLQRVQMTDVLGRPVVQFTTTEAAALIADRPVMVTGAAGSIGSELVDQVARLRPRHLLLLDTNESGLFDLQTDLAAKYPTVAIDAVVASVTDREYLAAMFGRWRPDVVFHAAAYKHVPLMEQYPGEAIRTNIIGTHNVAMAAAREGAKRFVLVSTDKAVRPSSVMGASKRLAEALVADVSRRTGLSTCCVRFGNVLGSRGSVIPTFERQIRAGGPVTVTDPRMRRYFMTVEEATSLILQAGSFGDRNAIYILDMGEDVSILSLAERLIELHGLRPYRDIPIAFVGVRPGEKLRETLAHDFEAAQPSAHPKIRRVRCELQEEQGTNLLARVRTLERVARRAAPEIVRAGLMELVDEVDRDQADNLSLRVIEGQHDHSAFASAD